MAYRMAESTTRTLDLTVSRVPWRLLIGFAILPTAITLMFAHSFRIHCDREVCTSISRKAVDPVGTRTMFAPESGSRLVVKLANGHARMSALAFVPPSGALGDALEIESGLLLGDRASVASSFAVFVEGRGTVYDDGFVVGVIPSAAAWLVAALVAVRTLRRRRVSLTVDRSTRGLTVTRRAFFGVRSDELTLSPVFSVVVDERDTALGPTVQLRNGSLDDETASRLDLLLAPNSLDARADLLSRIEAFLSEA